MRPQNLTTKIFLDSGDPNETKKALEILGFLDGQTTNPSLIVKNPEAQARIQSGNKFSTQEIDAFYKKVVTEISSLLPNGSVSIEVYADSTTSSEAQIQEAREKYTWIPNAHIKFPITHAGLQAVETLTHEGMRANLTLNFSQDQAAAVYQATAGSRKGDIFISPFIGRLDDIGSDGLDLVQNILTMYKQGDGHVEVLAASIRGLEHFTNCLAIGADIITAPLNVLTAWAEAGMPIPSKTTKTSTLKPIPYEEVALTKPWQEYNLHHDFTDKGLVKFADDWNAILQK